MDDTIGNGDVRSVKITVASGKGGTGKTTVATSLALSLAGDADNGASPMFLDCDVEAPNAHLFMEPVFQVHHTLHLVGEDVFGNLDPYFKLTGRKCMLPVDYDEIVGSHSLDIEEQAFNL